LGASQQLPYRHSNSCHTNIIDEVDLRYQICFLWPEWIAVVRSVFIISDLHLGGSYPKRNEAGKRGFRLCTHADAIVRFVEERTEDAKRGATEIVLNGDTVDFLAETDVPALGNAVTWSSFTADPQSALAKFKAIVSRDKTVFDAFGPFLEAGGRLTILLGNHDIELSLPDVRQELRRALGVRPSHDYQFLYDNEAYVIGDALIEHGNRYDAWNQVDYDAVRHIRSFQSRRLPVPVELGLIPPAGSDMVTTVINAIKDEYAFIDLLKPETAAVVPMLLALEPGYRSRIKKIAQFYYRTRSHGLVSATMPKFGGDVRGTRDLDVIPGADTGGIGGQNLADLGAAPRICQQSSDDALIDALQVALGDEAEAFLGDIDEQIAEIDPFAAVAGEVGAFDTPSRVFGFAALLFGRTSQPYQKRLPALLRAMRGLQNTDTFKRGIETSTEYLDAAQDIADRGRFRYVVFGHTHLAKCVPLGNDRFYFNSGTWADVLCFPIEILNSETDALPALAAFVGQIKAGDFGDWTLFRPTYVRLELADDGMVTNAALLPAEGEAG